MADYDDKSYYEIQLEQKQLVLILMLMVAICVLFFFLGVYYVRGREPMQASLPKNGTPAPTPSPSLPATPEKVEAETVSRFFEPGEGKGSAKKDEFEGKVIAESVPADPVSKPPKETKGEGKEKAPAATPKEEVKTPAPTRVAPPEADPPPREAAGAGAFVVQIVAVKDEDRARKMMSELKSLGFPAYVKTEDGGEARFKVRVGPYSEREKANQAKDGLRAQYPGAFVSSD